MKKTHAFYWGAAGVLALAAFDVLAQTPLPSGGGGASPGCAISVNGDMTNGVMCQFRAAATRINRELINPAISTACVAVLLQWMITYTKDIFKPDLSDFIPKMAGMVTWISVTVALINGIDRMSAIFVQYLGLAGSLSSLSSVQFSPGYVIDKTLDAISATNEAFARVGTGDSTGLAAIAAIGQNMFSALMLMFANIFTFLAGLIVALSLFVAILEFWIMFAVAPLAFGLIPLSAFRDQGFAPIKGLLSLGLRVLILGVVVSVFSALTDVVVSAMNSASGASGESKEVMGAVWYYLAGMAGCAMMALSAGKIASAIASGSASFSGADAIKGGLQIATTAAAGAAVASAIPSALGSAAKSNAAGLLGRGLGRGVGSALNAFGPGPEAGKAELGVSPTSHAHGAPIATEVGAPLSPTPPASAAVGGGSSGRAGGARRTPTSAPASGIGEGGERRGAPSAAPSSGTSADARPAAAPSAAGGSPLGGGENAAGDASDAGIDGPAAAGSQYRQTLADHLGGGCRAKCRRSARRQCEFARWSGLSGS